MRYNEMIELAWRDHCVCEVLEEHFPADFAVSNAMYHMQQAIEKDLKAILMISGINPEFTHIIAKLVCECENAGIELPVSVVDVADTLTQWESTTRYDLFYDTSGNKYEKTKVAFEEIHALALSKAQQLESPEPSKEDR